MTLSLKATPTARIAIMVWMILLVHGFTTFSFAETVRLYFDPATPQITFAAGDIKAALEKLKPLGDWRRCRGCDVWWIGDCREHHCQRIQRLRGQ